MITLSKAIVANLRAAQRSGLDIQGITADQATKLRLAVSAFRRRAVRQQLFDPVFASGQCNEVSDDFLWALDKQGICSLATIEYYEVTDQWRYPYHFPYGMNFHWAVRVGGNLIIDWTARQFSPFALFPSIWTDSHRPMPDDEDQ